ncbi:MAG: hypothetical protein ACXWC0_30155, partial [Burkholderiales bacterium]
PLFWYHLVMSSLKSFLDGMAPIVGFSPAALYERQRALVRLRLLEASPGRGPGSGVALSADSVAVMVICILAAESLGDVDRRVVHLCHALPPVDTLACEHFRKGIPNFRTEVARVLSGQLTQFRPPTRSAAYRGIRVSRCWRGQIMRGIGALQAADYFVTDSERSHRTISITAEIEDEMLAQLIDLTQSALSQSVEGEDEG